MLSVYLSVKSIILFDKNSSNHCDKQQSSINFIDKKTIRNVRRTSHTFYVLLIHSIHWRKDEYGAVFRHLYAWTLKSIYHSTKGECARYWHSKFIYWLTVNTCNSVLRWCWYVAKRNTRLRNSSVQSYTFFETRVFLDYRWALMVSMRIYFSSYENQSGDVKDWTYRIGSFLNNYLYLTIRFVHNLKGINKTLQYFIYWLSGGGQRGLK
jgi:hypothetical protein